MSIDAVYIFEYDCLPYLKPTPMERDTNYLKQKYGCDFVVIDKYILYWDMPKYRLLDEDYKNLTADNILEKTDGCYFKVACI